MRILFVCVILLFYQCKTKDNNLESRNYFTEQINSRMAILHKSDSVLVNTQYIHTAFANLILLSKDVENLSASVNKATLFFDTLAPIYNINRKDLLDITTQMNLDEIEMTLRENELNFYNQLIFKFKKDENLMYTAQ